MEPVTKRPHSQSESDVESATSFETDSDFELSESEFLDEGSLILPRSRESAHNSTDHDVHKRKTVLNTADPLLQSQIDEFESSRIPLSSIGFKFKPSVNTILQTSSTVSTNDRNLNELTRLNIVGDDSLDASDLPTSPTPMLMNSTKEHTNRIQTRTVATLMDKDSNKLNENNEAKLQSANEFDHQIDHLIYDIASLATFAKLLTSSPIQSLTNEEFKNSLISTIHPISGEPIYSPKRFGDEGEVIRSFIYDITRTHSFERLSNWTRGINHREKLPTCLLDSHFFNPGIKTFDQFNLRSVILHFIRSSFDTILNDSNIILSPWSRLINVLKQRNALPTYEWIHDIILAPLSTYDMDYTLIRRKLMSPEPKQTDLLDTVQKSISQLKLNQQLFNADPKPHFGTLVLLNFARKICEYRAQPSKRKHYEDLILLGNVFTQKNPKWLEFDFVEQYNAISQIILESGIPFSKKMRKLHHATLQNIFDDFRLTKTVTLTPR